MHTHCGVVDRICLPLNAEGVKPETVATKRFAKRFRELREAKSWSQEELASRTQSHKNYLGGIERCERNPHSRTFAKLAQALAVDIRRLVSEIESQRLFLNLA